MNDMIIKASIILPDSVQEFQIKVPNIYSHVSKAQFSVESVAALLGKAVRSKVGNNVQVTTSHPKTETKGKVKPKSTSKPQSSKSVENKFGMATSKSVFE